MDDHSTVLTGRLTLPEDVAWFNELDPEERNDFLMGLLNLVAVDDGNREKALNEYLRFWQAKSTQGIEPLDPLSRVFMDKVEQELDILLAQKKPTGDLVASVRKVRAQTAQIWSDPVNEAFFDRFAGEGT